ncbi:MAG: potassium transporter TrkG [Patulibacter sp.]
MPRLWIHPARALVLAFVVSIAVATGLLMLPAAAADGEPTPFVDALLHAATTLCVTGVTTLDPATHWSAFGHVVLLVCMQLGALGVMTFATLLGVLVARRLSFGARLLAAAETQTVDLGDLRRILRAVARYTVAIEAVVAVVLAGRWWLGYGVPLPRALWLGVFHAVSGFTNTGIALFRGNLMPFAGDPWVLLPLAVAAVLGGLGFPVLLEVAREFRRTAGWSLNTKLVLATTVVLLVVGGVFVVAGEWSNRGTLGAVGPAGRVLDGFFQATMTRSGGYNVVDLEAMRPTTWLGMDLLMLIGAGPAGTGGGIKVTTFAVLALLVWSEVRGHESVHAFGKRVPASALRQAMTVFALSSVVVLGATMVLMATDGFGLDRSAFEVVSAFATVGLSTGITAELSDPGKVLLVVLMLAGRVGPITLASAIALRRTERRYEYAEERPIIG